MMKGLTVIAALTVAIALYSPIAMYFFGVSLSQMFDRAYFTIGGAAIALYAAARL